MACCKFSYFSFCQALPAANCELSIEMYSYREKVMKQPDRRALGTECQVCEKIFGNWDCEFQLECANPALKQYERPGFMLLFEIISLIFKFKFKLGLLSISSSEQQAKAGGPYLNLRAADHCTMILRDKTNHRYQQECN